MTKRVLVLVEGQTEERFVKDVLAPAFWRHELYIEPTVLMTKRVKDGPNFRGGVTNFIKFKNDVNRLLNDAGDALVTTFLDYYALPADFPGMMTRGQNATGSQCVLHVEAELHKHFGSANNFLPFLALHEFEALLFSDADILPRVMNSSNKQAEFSAIRNSFDNPEEINNRPETAPSKRILRLFPGYRKTLHGPITATRIGLKSICEACPHFSAWVDKLEDFARL
ncbi:DUF4276 family protein [Collimonas arenae]|uniref:DUF4276 family protein n=1 Tax=Collimonas arenae TaxID=279058 RepID=UPI00056E8EAD|nr:DUF4276 family protein [Collimonas arenae]